jgi:hypothetical protein
MFVYVITMFSFVSAGSTINSNFNFGSGGWLDYEPSSVFKAKLGPTAPEC